MFWTNAAGIEGDGLRRPTVLDAINVAPRLYSVAVDFDWTIKADWTIDPKQNNKVTENSKSSEVKNTRVHDKVFMPAAKAGIEVRSNKGATAGDAIFYRAIDYLK